MKKKKLIIGIKSLDEFEQEARADAKLIDAGIIPKEPKCRVYFADDSTLYSTLSPKRWELLKSVRSIGPISIRKLAAELKRDYKNVYEDVKQLSQLGLIRKRKDELLSCPWDKITIELDLPA